VIGALLRNAVKHSPAESRYFQKVFQTKGDWETFLAYVPDDDADDRQLALTKLYRCVASSREKIKSFEKSRSEVSIGNRTRRVIVVEVHDVRPNFEGAVPVVAELWAVGQILGRFRRMEKIHNPDLPMFESTFLVGELPLRSKIRLSWMNGNQIEAWVDVPLYEEDSRDLHRIDRDSLDKKLKDALVAGTVEDSSSVFDDWRSMASQSCRFVPINGRRTLQLFGWDDRVFVGRRRFPEITVSFTIRKPMLHVGAYSDFISRPPTFRVSPEMVRLVKGGKVNLTGSIGAIKRGWVKKVKVRSGGSISNEKLRWIELQKDKIAWYKDRGDTKPLGTWNVKDVRVERCKIKGHSDFVHVKKGAKGSTKSMVPRKCLVLSRTVVVGDMSMKESMHFIFDQITSSTSSEDTCTEVLGQYDVVNVVNSWAKAIRAVVDLNLEQENQRRGWKEQSRSSAGSTRSEDCIAMLSTDRLWPHEIDTMWRERKKIMRMNPSPPSSLVAFLESVDILDDTKRREAETMMVKWPRPPTLEVLSMLANHFKDHNVYEYAVAVLGASDPPSWLIAMLLPQLVQSLKSVPFVESMLLYFLMEQGIDNFEQVGISLYWLLSVEVQGDLTQHARYERHFARCMQRFICLLESNDQYQLGRQKHLWSLDGAFAGVSRLAPSGRNSSGATKLSTPALATPSPFVKENKFALSSSMGKAQNAIDKAKKDALAQLEMLARSGKLAPELAAKLRGQANMLGADVKTDSEPKHRVIFKIGDDLRQDAVVLNLLSLMDQLWLAENLDLKMTPYCVVPTSSNSGVIQVVPDAKTMADWFGFVHGKDGPGRTETMLGSKHELTYVYDSLRKMNVHSTTLKVALETFAKSLAGYCVATHVLAIGDRHNDNMMMTSKGRFFHIDFGHILGHTKTKTIVGLTFDRECTTFVMTPAMKYALDQGGCFDKFREYCRRGLIVLRRNKNLLLSMLSLMSPANFDELSPQNIEVVKARLMLNEADDAVVGKRFDALIDDALGDSRKTLDDRIHIIKHKLSNKSKSGEEIRKVRSHLRELIANGTLPRRYLLPFGLRVGNIIVDECKPLSAATKPLMLVFSAAPDDKTADPNEWFASLDELRRQRSSEIKDLSKNPPLSLNFSRFSVAWVAGTEFVDAVEENAAATRSKKLRPGVPPTLPMKPSPTSLLADMKRANSSKPTRLDIAVSTDTVDTAREVNISVAPPSISRRGQRRRASSEIVRARSGSAAEKMMHPSAKMTPKERMSPTNVTKQRFANDEAFLREAVDRLKFLHVDKNEEASRELKDVLRAADIPSPRSSGDRAPFEAFVRKFFVGNDVE